MPKYLHISLYPCILNCQACFCNKSYIGVTLTASTTVNEHYKCVYWSLSLIFAWHRIRIVILWMPFFKFMNFTESWKCPLNFIFKFITLVLTEKLQSHFFTFTGTLSSEKSDSNKCYSESESPTAHLLMYLLTYLQRIFRAPLKFPYLSKI